MQGQGVPHLQRMATSRPSPMIHWTSRPPQACVRVMKNTRDDRLGERSAKLTGVLEDTVTLAAEVQRGGAPDDFRCELVVRIDEHLGEAAAILADIRNILDKPQ